nr:glycosyltransferase BC10 isoform X2 [Ipomoea batatas]GME19504.1 glycosyltransferase BC10 isoform X2 [Ipomoea batatas]
MEEEIASVRVAFARILLRNFRAYGDAVQSDQNARVSLSSGSSEAQNCVSVYSSEPASFGHCLGRIFPGNLGDTENKFSIHVHSRPGFLFSKITTRSEYFLDRQVNDSIQVDWGEASMIQAERILLQNALVDPFNERFVFLSDSCIPLYNFSYTYNYIMSTFNSFVDSFADTKEGRYNPKMHPVIPVQNWRKGSQKKPLPEFWREHPVPADTSRIHNCIPDEHYVATLLAQEGQEGEITRRTLTHTSWDLSSSKKKRERQGWHPVTYKLADATPMLIRSIKDVDNIYYETEYRREWCTSKGKPAPCFLFARKFTRPAALRLLNMSSLGVSREENKQTATSIE